MYNAMIFAVARCLLMWGIFSLIACSGANHQKSHIKDELNKVTGAQFLRTGTIVMKIGTTGNYPFNSSYENYDYSEKDVVLADEIFTDTLTKQNSRNPATAINYPGNYRRQIIFVKDKFEHKLVWINCFCPFTWIDTRWEKQIISFYDGGNCFFQVLIDLTDKKCISFSVNGIAF